MATCAVCGKENPDDARFCLACGTPFEAGPTRAREERKVVTVLFCDLVGSTQQAERMDPEDVRALLSRYHEQVRGDLERHGGTVEKFIGDAVMALFGAPIAHEDDPERAVRAALAIRTTIAEEHDLQVRIGVTTGEALVSLGARPAEGEGMASGDVVNTAARLQSAAPAGGILVDQATFRATKRAISYSKEPAVDAKGKAQPIAVWAPVEARARFGTDVRQLGRAALVGRQRELSLLLEMLGRVKEEREPQLVTLVGVPGIGKSRLVWELFQHVDAEPDFVAWRQGRSLPYGEGIALWALGEIVKAQAGVLESDTREKAAAKLHETLSEVVEEDVDWVEEHMRTLIGVGVEGEADNRRTEAFAAWRLFLEALARRGPLVLVFEDLHWADDNLLDFVDYLAEWASGVPLLAVCTARPELLVRRPDWGGGKANATTLRLSALDDKETARLVHELLERAVLPADLQAALLERAGGNPLYAEEFVRMLGERGADSDALPESVQGIIAARLDVLELKEKELLQDAAVFGKVFWPGAVTAIEGRETAALEQLLHGLARKDFVRREQRSSLAGETEFAFRHALVRDVAYHQIPRAQRAVKHARAAEWIERLGRPEDHAELLAHHYSTALELTRAAGRSDAELAEPTARALRTAGQRALALNAFATAADYLRGALDLSPADADRAELLFELGRADFLARQEGRDALEAARDSFLETGNRERAAETEALLAELAFGRGEGELLDSHLERAGRLVAELPASPTKAYVVNQLARFRMAHSGQDAAAIEMARTALGLAEELGLDEEQAQALNTIGVARFHLGELRGIEDVERSLEIARSCSSIRAISRCANNVSYVAQFVDLQRCREVAAELEQLLERLGDTESLRFLRANHLGDQLEAAAWDEVVAFADEFIARCEAGSPHTLEPLVRERRAQVRLGRSDLNGALDDAWKALTVARESGHVQSVVPALCFAAWILAQAGSHDQARALGEEALSLKPDDSSLVWNLAWTADELGLGDVVRALVQRLPQSHPSAEAISAIAHGDFGRAADLLGQVGWSNQEALARLRAAERLVAEGRHAEADDQLQRSLGFWRAAGATRYIREGEGLLAESA